MKGSAEAERFLFRRRPLPRACLPPETGGCGGTAVENCFGGRSSQNVFAADFLKVLEIPHNVIGVYSAASSRATARG